MVKEYYPPGAFYFSVSVLGSLTRAVELTEIDASFQEISGIKAAFDVEDVTEGGENRFVHHLPKAAKYPNLVLKRGLVSVDSALGDWVGKTVGSNLATPIVVQDLLVSLLNTTGQPRVSWRFNNAYPVSWQVSSLDSQQNVILTESLEFAYHYCERTA